jgi:hypothetical protein
MLSKVGERASGMAFIRFYCAISECGQEGQYRVVGFVPWHMRASGREFLERLLLGGQVCLKIDVCGLDALVTQPERNHRDVYSRLQQMHSRRMTAMSLTT